MNTHLQYTNNSGTSQTLAITDLLTSANSGNYGYDALNRLKTETKGNSQNTFDYDPVGNRNSKANENTATNTTDNQTLTYAISSNRLATKDGNALAHDDNGNILQDGTKSWTYNARNRMSQFKLNGVVQADYQHNAQGERVLKKHGSETIAYFYNGAGQLLNEIHYNNSGEQTAHTAYIWLGDMPLAVIKQNHSGGTITHSQIAYIHSDHLNTPRIATDQTGQTLWQWQSTAFGEQAANEDVDGDGQLFTLNLRFPGQYYDQESGLNYNYYRDYDPTTGRYVQSDPIGLAGGINTYGYAYQNSLRWIDSLGLYGTQSCTYWSQTCEANQGGYECNVAPQLCPRFPDNDDPGGDSDDIGNWSECARQCLQERHNDRMPEPQSCSADNNISPDDNVSDHLDCWAGCLANPENPYDSNGPDLPDGYPSIF